MSNKEKIASPKISEVQKQLIDGYSRANSLKSQDESDGESCQTGKIEPIAEMSSRLKRLTYTGIIRNPFIEQNTKEKMCRKE